MWLVSADARGEGTRDEGRLRVCVWEATLDTTRTPFGFRMQFRVNFMSGVFCSKTLYNNNNNNNNT